MNVSRIVFLLLLMSMATVVYAQDRHIHINGEHLDDQNIAILDQTLGSITPDGFYWIDFNSGNWGYEGNQQVMGNIMAQENVQYQPPQHQPQLDSNAGNSKDKIYNWGDGGYVQGEECSYASVGGTTMRLCD